MYGKRTHFFHKPVESSAGGFGCIAQRNVDIRNLTNSLRFVRQQRRGIVCHIPSHAYFEYVVACVTHFKREPHKLREHSINPEMIPNGRLEGVKLDNEYANHLLRILSSKPYPIDRPTPWARETRSKRVLHALTGRSSQQQFY